MNTDYAIDHDEVNGTHVQVEMRRVTDDGPSGPLGGRPHWHAERRVLVDGEPVSEWMRADRVHFDELPERADHPDVDKSTLRDTADRAESVFFDENPELESCPWWGSSGWGGHDDGPWLLG